MTPLYENDVDLLNSLIEDGRRDFSQRTSSQQSDDSATSLPDIWLRQQQQQQHHSPWDFESTTPMTTRPHFYRHDFPSSAQLMKRVRSRSLGTAESENVRPIQRSLLIPPFTERATWLRENGDNNKTVVVDAAAAAAAITVPRVQQQVRSIDVFSYSGSPNVGKHVASELVASYRRKKKSNEDEKTATNPIWVCVLYGMINATIVLPVLMSFGGIIYRDDAYAPCMPVLVKLTVVSGMVHQICFSSLSSLPFAVGQVQDAGLIFLSSMASQIVQYCRMQGHDDATMLATSTIGLSLATAVLGCGLVLVGKLRLAQYVQFLPTCVVGGYLAFIGWFCGISGVMLMAGSSNLTLAILRDKFVFVLPGLAGGALIYLAVTKLRHMAALPTSIFMEICIFYMILWATGTTVDEATDDGWIRRMEKPLPLLHTWDFFRFDKVDWSVFPNLILTELSMIFVVSLSSSLDVAAIEIELNKPLHYNHELKMVGISNIVSGITGGYTGSYIFSQSIFSLRAGIRSRLAGFVLALVQFLVLALPFPILKYVPNFFFGSLLAMICIDLMFEWLWDVRHRVTRVEHWICFSTFALIHVLEVEYGILAGVTLYLACKKAGFDVGESKFISHEDILEEEAIIEMQVDDMDSDDTSSKPTCYGTM